MTDPYNDPKANREIEDAIERGTDEGKQTLAQFMETSKGRRQAEDALLDAMIAMSLSGVRVNVFSVTGCPVGQRMSLNVLSVHQECCEVYMSEDMCERLKQRIDEHNRRHQ